MRLLQLRQADRLADVVVRARLEAEHGVGLRVERGEHDDRHRVVAVAQRAADLVAVRPGAERGVEQHDVEAVGGGAVDRRPPVSDGERGVPFSLERAGEGFAQRRLVVDDEDREGAVLHVWCCGYRRALRRG